MIEPRKSEGSEMYRREKSERDRKPRCRKCLIRPEGIARTGLCHKCRNQIDRDRAEAELKSVKPMEW